MYKMENTPIPLQTKDRLDNIINLHMATLSNVCCYYFVFLSNGDDNPRLFHNLKFKKRDYYLKGIIK